MTRAAWCFMGAMIIFLGAYQIVCPTLFQEDEDAERPDPSAPPPLRPIWKVRLIGVFFVVVGILWIYMVLFGEPADEPALV